MNVFQELKGERRADNFNERYVKDGNSFKVYIKFNGSWLYVYRIFN